MEKPKRSRHLLQGKKRIKAKTNKLVDRLTYIPSKHKQKITRELRSKLQEKSCPPPKVRQCSTTLKFGSHNINGLDLEASWAVNELLKTRDFDVRILIWKLFGLSLIIIGSCNQ